MQDMKMLTEVMKDLNQQTEDMILEQLGMLVSRGLLVIEKGPMTIVEAYRPAFGPDPMKLEMRQSVRIVLKDQEYIKKLEDENEELRSIFARVKDLC